MKKLVILLLFVTASKCMAQCPWDTCIQVLTGDNPQNFFDQILNDTTIFKRDISIKENGETGEESIAVGKYFVPLVENDERHPTGGETIEVGKVECTAILYPSSFDLHWKWPGDSYEEKIMTIDRSGYLKSIFYYNNGGDEQEPIYDIETGKAIDQDYSTVAGGVLRGQRLLTMLQKRLLDVKPIMPQSGVIDVTVACTNWMRQIHQIATDKIKAKNTKVTIYGHAKKKIVWDKNFIQVGDVSFNLTSEKFTKNHQPFEPDTDLYSILDEVRNYMVKEYDTPKPGNW